MKELTTKFKRSRKLIASKLAFGVRPRAQFRHLMMAMTVLFLAVFALHVYLFYRIESHTIFQGAPEAATAIPSVNESKLATVLVRFEDKALIRSAALGLVPAVSDPSR